jgi:hypothetical protein
VVHMNQASYANWPFKWFGCWRELGSAYSSCPSIEEFVDEDWQYSRRADLVDYLSSAPIVATTSRMAFPWAKGRGDSRSSVSYRTDGVWLWLDDLDYYVTEQSVRLPDAFVAAIEERHFKPPSDDDLGSFNPMDLPWPPVES